MESEDKKVVVNLPEGASTAEVIIREGEAPKVLSPKPPVKIDLSGVIGSPVEYLTQRSKESDQFNEKRAHVIIDREKDCETSERTTYLIPGLIATSEGYYLATSEQELMDYEDSLRGREEAIKAVRLAIARQRRMLYEDAHNPVQQTIKF